MIKKQVIGMLFSLGALQPFLAADGCCPPEVIPGEPIECGQLPAIYPQPASVLLKDNWDAYVTGDFIYWTGATFASDVGMKNTASGGTRSLGVKDHYRPGFKVAVGVDTGVVVLDTQYIRWHHNYTTNYSSNAGESITPFAFPEYLGFVLIPNFAEIKTKTKINFDQLYLTMQRPVYAGTRLVLNMSVGALAQWYTQDLVIRCFNEIGGPAPGGNGEVIGKHTNWFIGPAVGIRAKALLGGGLRLIGNVDLSLGYQQWTRGVGLFSFPPVNPANPFANGVEKYKGPHDRLKTVGETSLGLGWERYVGDGNYHIYLAVTYDAITTLGNTPAIENVIITDTFLHGWTLEGRFDF